MKSVISAVIPVLPLVLPISALLLAPKVAIAEDTSVERPPIVLGRGEQRVLRVPGLLRYSLGGSVARAYAVPKRPRLKAKPERMSSSLQENPERDLILLKGIESGIGDLWIWTESGVAEHRSIRVEKVLETELRPALERALSRLQESEVHVTGKGAVIRGTVRTIGETARIAHLVQEFPKEVSDQTQLSSELLSEGRTILESWLKSSRYSSKLNLEEIDGELWIRGSIENPTEQALAEKAIHSKFPRTQIDISSLPDSAPTVHFRVYLLELKRNKFASFGLSWPSGQEGAFKVSTSAIQDLLSLDLTLQNLEGDGSIKVLSKPELVVRAPGEAELFAGGELPIHMQSRFYSNYSWKSYGLTLRLKVTHTTRNEVRLDVFTEVSHLDSTVTTDKMPGIQTNRMKTQVDARYGKPLLLSGLLQQGTRENARGLPLLRQIPILGALFGSEDYLNERSELVAILLPNTTPPSSSIARVERFFPKGPVPAARNWVRPSDEKTFKNSPDYPWNVLE